MWAVWIALLLWATPTQGVSTTCEIPAVEKLQNTSLTCKFSEDISKLKQDFKVQYYKSNTTDSSEVILDCYWMDNNRPECTVHKCCQYDGQVTTTLTLRVLSVTETHVGRYVCFVLPAAPDSYNFCNFTLTEKQTDTPGSNPAAIAVPLVIVIAVIICIIIIVWRLKCNKKTEDKTMKKKTCHFCPVQRYSKEKETVDGEFNEGKQSLIECKFEENDRGQSTNIHDSKDRSIEKDLKSTDPTTAEKFGQKSDNIDGPHRHVQTSIKETVVTFFGNLFRREQVNQNAVPSCTPHQELSIVKIESPSTSVTGLETKPEEFENGQTDGDKPSVSDVTNKNALNKPALSESGTNVSISGINATVTESQKMQSPSDQNDVITPIVEQSSDDGTITTKETSQTLRGNELQRENETEVQKTQKSDVHNYTTDICTEGKLAENVIMKAMKKVKEAQEKSENERRILQDKEKKEIQNAREKAEKEEKLVKDNAENEEATAKAKAEKFEKIAKEKAEREERIADDKAKEEEKIAKDKAVKEEKIAKRTSKSTASTEEQVKKISNEKEEQMKKIAKRKEEQMEIIAKEKDKQLEKIAKEKKEELEKIENMKNKQLQEISKRKAEEMEELRKKTEEEMEELRKKTEEEMERIANMKEKQLKEISKKKEEKLDKIRKENEKQMEAKMQKKQKKNKSIKRKEERQNQKKGKEKNQTTIRESDEVQGSYKHSKEKESEDDACGDEHANETDPFLPTKNSNVQVNPATTNQSTTDTVIIMSELAHHQDTSEAPTGTQGQTLQAVDKGGPPVIKTNNEDIESNGKANKKSRCAVS